MKKAVSILLVALLLVGIVPKIKLVSSETLIHGPTEIVGNSGFTESGIVSGGNGTPQNPYIIENLVINATGAYKGLSIKHTTAYFIIRNITVYGADYGIYLENVTNFVIEDSVIYNVNNDAILIQESTNGLIQNNTIHNASTGIKLTDWDDIIHVPNHNITITNNHIFGITWYGIDIEDMSFNNTVTNNLIELTHDDGIFIWGAGQGNKILKNTIQNTTEAGIYIGYTNGTEIAYNTIRYVNGYGIGIGRGSYNDIHDNNIASNTGQGIYIHHSTGNEIYKNNITENGNEGILLYVDTKYTVIRNNIIANNSFGIYSWGSNITIFDNTIENNLCSGVSLRDGYGSVVNENTILNVIYGDGIYIWNSTENVISNNTIRNTGEDGIQLQYSPNNTISNNYIDHGNVSTAQGIDAHDSPYLVIEDNTITITNNGIYLFQGSYNSSIIGNTVFGTGAGIVITDSDNMTINENILNNNSRQGIVVLSSNNVTVSGNHIEGSGYNGVEFYNVVSGWVQHNYFTKNEGGFQADNSTALVVSDNTMTSTKTGIALRDNTHDTIVRDNVITNNEKGFWIWESNNNTFINNTITGNMWTGVYMYNSSGNIFYLNHFDNHQNAILENSIARWYSLEPISYDYNGTSIIIPGTQFTSYIGNYWSDYNGPDSDDNGIGNVPYVIDSQNRDLYPIGAFSNVTTIQPIEIYGDNDFLEYPGLITGSGTPDDPYVIKDVTIDAGDKFAGIRIQNTRAHFIIRNVTIYGGSYGIYLDNVTNFVIQYSTIHHVQYDAIEIQESADGVIENNTIYNASTGIKLTDWDNVLHVVNHNITISNNHIFDITWYGVEIGDLSGNNTVSGNTIENTHDDGIFIWEAGTGNRILNNIIQNTIEAGIYIGYTNGTEIAYNTINSITGYGIGIGRGSYNDIHDNNITSNTGQGIYIHHSTDNEIYKNIIENNLNQGILLYVGTYNTLVHDNNVTNNGFGVYSWGINVTITHNFFQNNSYSGISLKNCERNTVSENTILDVIHGDGIYIWNSTKNIISNNTIRNTGEDGIQLQYSPNNTISSNYIDHGNVSTAQCIDAYDSPNLLIQDNTITNANNGLYLSQGSHGANITGNTIINNGAGIVITDSDNMTISKNILNNNSRQAVTVVNSHNITLSENHIEGSGYNGVEFYNVISGWVQHNYFTRNRGGFQADNSTALIVAGNTMTSTKTGIALRDNTWSITVRDNIITNNEKGFWLWESNNNTFINNTITGNMWTGVYMYNSSGNIFYLNHFDNHQNAILENSIARWYSLEPISYDYNGTSIIIPGTQFTSYIGNYWSDYTGRDTNGDGIGEEPYHIDTNNSDPYPISYMTPPIVLTDIPKNLSNISVILSGTLLDLGGSTDTEVWFEYGTTPDNLTRSTTHLLMNDTGMFEITLTNLTPNTTYHFRAVAKNPIETTYGRTVTFTTPLTGNYTPSPKGPSPELVRITPENNQSQAIMKIAGGKVDIYLSAVPGYVIQNLSSDVLGDLKLFEASHMYNDIEVNPVHDDDNPYLITVNNETYFNPLAIRDIRYALNFLISRDYIVQQILQGSGEPMIGGIRPSTWASTYFEPVYSALLITSAGNKNKALLMIDNAMNEAAQELAAMNYSLVKVNNTWYFEGKPVTLKFIIRIEDQRYDIGQYVSGLLEEAGFKVEKLLWDRSQASATVYTKDPRDYLWNMYTAGWAANRNIKWPDGYTAFWYAPWYGWVPAPSGWEFPESDLITVKELINELGGANATITALQLEYYNTSEKLAELYNMTVNEVTKMLVQGNVEFNNQTYVLEEGNLDQYWDLQKISMALGVRDSQKVFLSEVTSYYPANRERVVEIASDTSLGLFTRWSLITAETPDRILRVATPTTTSSMNAFNPYGGINSLQTSPLVWDVLYDPPMFPNLMTGTYVPVRCNYTVERGNITVPADAVIYNSTVDQWIAAHAGESAKAKITYTCEFSNWHDGQPMTIADIKYATAFIWEWSNKDGDSDPYYDSNFANVYRNLAGIKGIEWVDNGTYIVYTDNVHTVADDVTAHMNVFWPSMPWQLYYAMGELVARPANYSIETKYAFNYQDGVWLDLLNPAHVADLKKVIEALKAKNAVPAPITADVTDPIPGYDALIDWINSKGHAVVSNGPFYLDYYYPKLTMLELRAFRDPTYPLTLEEIKQRIGIGDYNPPTVMNFNVTPITVEVGNNTTISWSVIDESEITEVLLDITLPNGTVITESFDPALGTYTYTYAVPTVGTYTVTLKVTDKWGNTNTISAEFYGERTIIETITVNETTSNVTVQNDDLELGIDLNETAVSNETQLIINATITPNEEDLTDENVSSLAVAPVVANTTENETTTIAPIKYVKIDVENTGNQTPEEIVEKYTLKIQYTDAEIQGIDENTLSLYYWNGSTWIRVTDYINKTLPNGPFVYDAGVNTEENCVWAVVNHFSVYALGGISKPLLNITFPLNGTEFYTNTTMNITVTWEAKDKLGIDHYEVRINNGTWIKTSKTEYTFYDLSAGEYTVEVRAVNLGGQSTVATVTFKIKVPTEREKRLFKKLKKLEKLYLEYTKRFEEAYNNATSLGVDTTILNLALEYKLRAEEHYTTAKDLGYTITALHHMRFAVLNIKWGYRILAYAIRWYSTNGCGWHI